jgi:hypothetical protein
MVVVQCSCLYIARAQFPFIALKKRTQVNSKYVHTFT